MKIVLKNRVDFCIGFNIKNFFDKSCMQIKHQDTRVKQRDKQTDSYF